MSTITPLYKVSKGFAKAALSKTAKGQAAKNMQEALNGIQSKVQSFEDKFAKACDADQQAKAALEQARSGQGGLWNWFFGARVDLAPLQDAERKAARKVESFQNRAENNIRQEQGLKALTLKHRVGGAGQEYFRVQSQPFLGQKHPVLKVSLPVRKDQKVIEYVQKSLDFAGDYVTALNRRLPHVSPRIATRGNAPEVALKRYKDTMGAFDAPMQEYVDAEGAPVLRGKVAADLAQQSIQTKVLQNGKFRIQVQNRDQVGRLNAKIKLAPKATMDAHVEEGLNKAVRLNEAVKPDATTPHLSYKVMRNNFVQKRVDFKALESFEAAKEVLATEAAQARIQALQAQGIQVKILRDKSFRITRLNNQGVVAKTRTLSFPKGGNMDNHITNGLNFAENMGNQALPAKISTSQKAKNKFRPFKKAVLNFIG